MTGSRSQNLVRSRARRELKLGLSRNKPWGCSHSLLGRGVHGQRSNALDSSILTPTPAPDLATAFVFPVLSPASTLFSSLYTKTQTGTRLPTQVHTLVYTHTYKQTECKQTLPLGLNKVIFKFYIWEINWPTIIYALPELDLRPESRVCCPCRREGTLGTSRP